MKPIKNILCYSHYDFDRIMEKHGWVDSPASDVCCISICSPNELDLSEHWFKKDWTIGNVNVFNLDIDDVSPFWFNEYESELYDESLNKYLNGDHKYSDAYFNYMCINSSEDEHYLLHALDYSEAFKLAAWIDIHIHEPQDTFYIHCAAGASRSQGVVRYIIDTYGDEFDIKLNPYNPNNTYNPHVVMMLKRAYRVLFNYERN